MAQLTEIFPDADVMLQLPPDDLAPVVLHLAQEALQNGRVHPQAIFQQVHGPRGDHSKGYPQNRKDAAERALNVAWNLLLRNGLLIPEPGPNGQNGWHELSEEAAKIASKQDFESFRQAASFPKSMLHPSIADAVWLELARGEYDTAVFKAFRAVEERVRGAGNFANTDVGKDLMRKAFGANGPLTSTKEAIPEQESLAHLFAGAIGYFKNPQSHRTVNVDPAAAREATILASLLLRVVDEREPK